MEQYLMVVLVGLQVAALVCVLRLLWTSKPVRAHRRRLADSDLDARAGVLVREVDARDASGEYKRHVVYGRLQKEFPDATKRAIAWAIEQALPEK